MKITTEIHNKLKSERMKEMMDKYTNSYQADHQRSIFWAAMPSGTSRHGRCASAAYASGDADATAGAAARRATGGESSGPGYCANSRTTGTFGQAELMASTKPVVVVTGIAGNLGSRLLPLLGRVLGDWGGLESTPNRLAAAVRAHGSWAKNPPRASSTNCCATREPVSVVHLAFVIDPVRTGVLDVERMWQINVAGTARVMEAITEANRTVDVGIRQFIFPSSVSVYGPSLPAPATEESPLAAHTLPYAIHKKQCDEVVQQRSPALRGCSVYILRPHIFAGRQRGKLFAGSVSRNAQRKEHAGRKDAQRGQAAALHAAAWPAIS